MRERLRSESWGSRGLSAPPRQDIAWNYGCDDVSHLPTDGDPGGGHVQTDANGDFSVQIDNVACHTAEFGFSHPYTQTTEGVGPVYVVVTTSYDTAEIAGSYTEPPWNYVGDEVTATYTYTVDGTPQQNAVVTVDETLPDQKLTLPADHTTTDDQGTFTIHLTKSSPGDYTLFAHVAAAGNTLAGGQEQFFNAAVAQTNLNATITGVSVPGYPRTLAGTLTRGDSNGGATIHLDAHDSGGGPDRLQDTVTAADGSFSFTDTPQLPGGTTYHLTYDGDGVRYYPSSWLDGVAENLIVPVPHVYDFGSPYAQGDAPDVVAEMTGDIDPKAVITVTRQPADGSGTPTVLFSDVWANMPPAGVRPTTPMTENTTFTISTPSTISQQGATASTTALVSFGVSGRALHPYLRTTAGVAVYRPHDVPVIRAQVAPHRAGVCVRYDLAQMTALGWQTIRRTGCHPTGNDGRAIWRITRALQPGKYRVRPQAAGDPLDLAGQGHAVPFRIRQR